jgi:hypothetical protein
MIFSEDSMIFVGCSYTSGVGLENRRDCYSTVMCDRLNKKEFNFAYGGANNYSSFDKISKLNLAENTSLVLQITQLGRIKYYDYDHQAIKDRVFSSQPDRTLMSVYPDEFLIYELNRYLELVTRYTRAAKIKLIIWSIADSFDNRIHHMVSDCVSQFQEYVYLESKLDSPGCYRVDNGTDGVGKSIGSGHPGPKSHQLIADKLISHYKDLYS